MRIAWLASTLSRIRTRCHKIWISSFRLYNWLQRIIWLVLRTLEITRFVRLTSKIWSSCTIQFAIVHISWQLRLSDNDSNKIPSESGARCLSNYGGMAPNWRLYGCVWHLLQVWWNQILRVLDQILLVMCSVKMFDVSKISLCWPCELAGTPSTSHKYVVCVCFASWL